MPRAPARPQHAGTGRDRRSVSRGRVRNPGGGRAGASRERGEQRPGGPVSVLTPAARALGGDTGPVTSEPGAGLGKALGEPLSGGSCSRETPRRRLHVLAQSPPAGKRGRCRHTDGRRARWETAARPCGTVQFHFLPDVTAADQAEGLALLAKPRL